MATQNGLMQGLLSSIQPWLLGAAPSSLDQANAQYGGMNGLMSAFLQDSPGSQGAAAMGRAMQGIQDDALQRAGARQKLAMGNIGLQQSMATFPIQMFALQNWARQHGMAAPQSNAPQAVPQSGIAAPPAGPVKTGLSPQSAPQSAPSGAPGVGSLDLAELYGIMKQDPGAITNAVKANPAYLTQAGIAKDPLTLDRAMYAESVRNGAPAGAQNPYYLKFLKDSGMVNVAAYNGALTTLGGVTPAALNASTLNPVQGIGTRNGAEYALPGAANAQATLAAAKEGASEAAKLRAGTAPAGGASPGIAPPAARAPQVQGAVPQGFQGADAVKQANFIPPILSRPSQISQQPGNTSLSQLQTFQKEQSEHASEYLDKLNEQSSSAQMLLTQADQIDNAARDFSPGKLADVKRDIMAWAQTIPGVLSPADAKALGSAQEGDKLSIQLQAAVTKQLGSREAAQVFSVMGRSIPNLTLTPDGLAKISAYLKGIARYQQAQNTFGQRLAAQGNVAGVNSLDSNFQTYSNPVYYILSSAPPAVAREFIANMPASQRAKVQAGWKQAISQGLAPAPGDYE